MKVSKVDDSDKLLKLLVDFGEETRQIIAGIGKSYEPENLMNKECPFIFNLEAKMIHGLESQGMILCADSGGEPVLLHPDKDITPGSIVK